MKTIGLLGGMSWESTATYYQLINQHISKQLGGLHSAQIILHSIDFDPLEKLQHQSDWQGCAKILTVAANKIESAGADFLLICTNTMHKVYPQIADALKIPVLHIADATAQLIKSRQIHKVGLIGTKFTMEQDFYSGRLEKKYAIEVIIPPLKERNRVHQVIYGELCLGNIRSSSRDTFIGIIENLRKQGAEAIILGCTEISLLIQPEHTAIELLDTTEIHALAAVEFALKE